MVSWTVMLFHVKSDHGKLQGERASGIAKKHMKYRLLGVPNGHNHALALAGVFLGFRKLTLVGGWTNPFEKYYIVKLDHFLKDPGENKQIFEITV